jgi:cell wall-associated NlpC family hydrolase
VAWARQYGLTVKESRPGDLVTFDWAHDGVGNHIGLVQAWPSTIEGNTSEGNNSNGGEVMRRLRNRADVLVFIRLDL